MTVRTILRIRSGGETGADRAALDAALEFGLDVAGWCPAGGWAEDFPEPPGLLVAYPQLRPTPSADPAQRTAWNVRDAHATLVVGPFSETPSPGSDLTVAAAHVLVRPLLRAGGADPDVILHVLDRVGLELTLNVAGPRESEAPGTYAATLALLRAILERDRDRDPGQRELSRGDGSAGAGTARTPPRSILRWGRATPRPGAPPAS